MTTPRPVLLVIVGTSLSTGLSTFVRACHDRGAAVGILSEAFHHDSPIADDLAELHAQRLRLADVAVELPCLDLTEVLTTVRDLADRYDVRGVYAGNEQYVELAARVAATYELPGPGLRAATISRNKLMQRLLCQRAGVPVPAFTLARTAEDAYRFVADHAPVVVKPWAGWGSDRVRRLDSSVDLKEYLAETGGGPLMLESYVAGREVSVECLVSDGRPMLTNVTHKGKGPEPFFVETLQAVPADLPAPQRAACVALATRVVELTGMVTGILHLEAISRPEEGLAYPVEWAVREPGHAIMDLIDWRFGERATLYLVAMHLGQSLPEVPDEDPERIAVTVFMDLPAGVIAQVRRDRDPNEIPGMVDFDFYASVGDPTGPARDNWSTLGAYSAFATDRTHLRRILDDLDAAFGVRVRLTGGDEVWFRPSETVRTDVLGDHGGPGGEP